MKKETEKKKHYKHENAFENVEMKCITFGRQTDFKLKSTRTHTVQGTVCKLFFID